MHRIYRKIVLIEEANRSLFRRNEIANFSIYFLVAVVSKSLVGFSHLVRIVFLLDRCALSVGGIENLSRESFCKRTSTAFAAVSDDPLSCKRNTAGSFHFYRNLICRTTDAASFYFDKRRNVLNRFVEYLKRLLLGLFGNDLEGRVEESLSSAAFAALHHAVDEPLNKLAIKLRIRRWNALDGLSSSGHFSSSPRDLGCLAPPTSLGHSPFGLAPGSNYSLHAPDFFVGMRPNPKGSQAVLLLSSARFGSFGTVFGASLHAVFDTSGIKCTTDDVVANARKILDPSTSYKHNAVLLQVVTDARNVSGNFDTVGESYTSNLSKSRVRLLRCGRLHLSADASALRARFQGRRFGLEGNLLALVAD